MSPIRRTAALFAYFTSMLIKVGIAYMDVAVRRPGKGREQERKLEGVL